MASFFAYALLLFFATLKHTFWRDEAEAWMVARSSSTVLSLLHNSRYEGHPPLWYLVLYGLSRFSWNPDWMKLPNFLFAIVAVGLILTAFRLSLPVRLGLIFSYYMLFEYGLLTRNYMFGIVFLLAAVTVLRRRDEAAAGVWVPILLSPLRAHVAARAARLVLRLPLLPVHALRSSSRTRHLRPGLLARHL